jgi:S-adenosylmethionine:tRNA ribosyltransferase-isomerase
MEISEHQMHNEQFFFTKEAIDTIRSHKGKIIAVGTTSVRAIESLYWFGLRLKSRLQSEDNFEISQWEPYLEDSVITREESFSEVLRYMDSKGKGIIYGSTRLMILPGYRFRTCSGMITNFHQPGSTLLLLVAAATGERWRDIYDYALNNGFRFLSYGDVSLII